MEVKINLFGNLGHFLPPGGNRATFTRSFDGATTAGQMLEELGLAGKATVIVVVNNVAVEPGHELHDRDEVSIFRPSGGG